MGFEITDMPGKSLCMFMYWKRHSNLLDIEKGVVHAKGRPTAAFDPEGLIFALGVDSSTVKMYDLRAYESVSLDTV